MIKGKLFIRLILCMMLFISCKHQIHSGVVVDKTYESPEEYIYYTSTTCGSITTLMPHTAYDDEDYILSVTGIKGSDTITEDFYVSKATFKCVKKGSVFNDSIPCEREDDRLR